MVSFPNHNYTYMPRQNMQNTFNGPMSQPTCSQQGAANGDYHAPAVHPWYNAGYHQAAPLPSTNWGMMQEDQPVWHSSHPHQLAFLQQHHHDIAPVVSHAPGMTMPPMGAMEGANPIIPSPPITIQGSDLSSPTSSVGKTSPIFAHQHPPRPTQTRSPYEWIRKTPAQPNPGKTRTKDKYRVVYTDKQRMELEKEFYYSRYITIRRKSELASNLGLSERQVKIWFQNRRAKERKQLKKQQEIDQKNPLCIIQQQQQQTMAQNQAIAGLM